MMSSIPRLVQHSRGRWTVNVTPLVRQSSSNTTTTTTNSRLICYHPRRLTTSSSRSITRRSVPPEQREALRKARKERALKLQETTGSAANGATQLQHSSPNGQRRSLLASTGWVWYVGLGVPIALVMWGINDEDSPPAKFASYIGLTAWIEQYTDEYTKPYHDKLLPSWSDMVNVPHDITPPHTLVIDLEQTLMTSTWDRKYGWRHAKRPGVDNFLKELMQYYELVLFSSSPSHIAEDVVDSLDPNGIFLHRLYREATHYVKGVPVKDLDSLNRNLKRVIVLDDDPNQVQFHPQNLIRVKPYDDPNDLTDRTLERITPFLVEIVREGYDNIPELLERYKGMDADQIADEYERRIEAFYQASSSSHGRQRREKSGLASWAAQSQLQSPLMSMAPDGPSAGSMDITGTTKQLTARDIAASASASASSSSNGNGGSGGLFSWLNQRSIEKEQAEHDKMLKWEEAMRKKEQQQ